MNRRLSGDSLPKWVAEEIRNAKFGEEEEWSGSGYILDINKDEKKIDVQFYEKLPEGRYIATLDLPEKYQPESLEPASRLHVQIQDSKSAIERESCCLSQGKIRIGNGRHLQV